MFDAVPTSEAVVEVDTEMEKFQNLLQDYLTGTDPRFVKQISFANSSLSERTGNCSLCTPIGEDGLL